MSDLLEQLYADHEHIRELLGSLHHHLDEVATAGRSNNQLLSFGLSRWKDFLDETHHSKEEYVFSKLHRRALETTPAVRSLALQHNELERHMQCLTRAFSVMHEQDPASHTAMINAGHQMLNEYLNHLQWEEDVFFPLARHHLHANDWRDIETEWARDNHNPWREISQGAALQAFAASSAAYHQ